MTRPTPPIRALLLVLACVAAQAQSQIQTPIQTQIQIQTQTQIQAPNPNASAVPMAVPTPARKPRPRPSQPTLNPGIVFLDPGHGGADTGARLGTADEPGVLEKDITIAFADRLKTALTARGFTVLLTHDSAADAPTLDLRAELANRSRASACLLLHASNGGHGVHLFTSSLTASAPFYSTSDEPRALLPWDSAQSALVSRSFLLAGDLADSFRSNRIPLVVAHVSVQPIDSMTCPAVAIELSPLTSTPGSDPTPASDPVYQQRIADTVATGLTAWRFKVTAELAAQSAAAAPSRTSPAASKPVARPPTAPPRKPNSIPVETPDIVSIPAPIIRRPPPNSQPSTPPAGPPQ